METEATDAELVARIRAGDRTAGDALLERHKGLIYRQIKRFRMPRYIDRNEVFQECSIAMYGLASRNPPDGWSATGGSKFSTYAHQKIFWTIQSVVGKYLMRAQTATDCGEDYDDCLVSDTPSAAVDDLTATLSPQEKAVVLAMHGFGGVHPAGKGSISLEKVAADFRLPKYRVSELLAAGVAKMKVAARPPD